MKEESWFILMLVTACLLSQARPNAHNYQTAQYLSGNPVHEQCFLDDSKYLQCKHKRNGGTENIDEKGYIPELCDCGNRQYCFIKLTIEKIENNGNVYSINKGAIGPTIVIKSGALLAVDVVNDSPDETSIHWHGMHMKHTPWMDGVAMVTQWSIPGNGKFRYILKAQPSGTHWYHSHVGTQRDEGIFGALIVKEKLQDDNKLKEALRATGSRALIDKPERFMIAVTEHVESNPPGVSCNVGSGQVDELQVSSFQINGIKLAEKKPTDPDQNDVPIFPVNYGHHYRFRVVGAVEQTVFRITIAGHKFRVIATDGYLVKPREFDMLHVHAGERYDFVVSTRKKHDVKNGNVFLIQIDSIDVNCDDENKPTRSGFAFLKYVQAKSDSIVDLPTYCENNCKALNCPFERYPDIMTRFNSYTCYDVTTLKLLLPTPDNELPFISAPQSLPTKFLNFHRRQQAARINDVKFRFSSIPFIMSKNGLPDECPYNGTKTAPENDTNCPHTIRLDKSFNSKAVELVFSSLPRGIETFATRQITQLITHPIHLHGHSFWVKKIVYPTYHPNGTVMTPSEDIDVPNYGYGHWKNSQCPFPVNPTTVRKDVIIVPAGGYVVVEFKVHNPGWWFLHCHIDHHLLEGMGIVLGEMPECIAPTKTLEKKLYSQPDAFCLTVKQFYDQVRKSEASCPPADDHLTAKRNGLMENELKVNKSPSSFNQEDDDELTDYKPNQPLDYEAEQQKQNTVLRAFRKNLDGESQGHYNSK